MADHTDAAVRSEFARLLEELTFALVEHVGAEEVGAEIPTGAITVSFTGWKSGRLSLCFPPGFGAHIAEAMLGVDPGETDEAQGTDAVRELLNVVAGNLLSALYGADAEFRLSIPRLGHPERERVTAEGAEFFDVDGYRIGLWIEEGEGS